MPQRAIQGSKAVSHVFLNCQTKPVQIVAEKAKAFHVLFHGAGDGLDNGI